jgi:hypothetical protein
MMSDAETLLIILVLAILLCLMAMWGDIHAD